MKNSNIILFEEKDKCCGCGACKNICPRQAIKMEEDDYGFIYPIINESLCIKCGKCKKVCNYGNDALKQTVKSAYVSAAKDTKLILKSASGGIFATLAETILEHGGVVYGVAMINLNNTLQPQHIRVTDKTSLEKLQGSKYVQSDTQYSFICVEKDLKENRKVLFSGTPCQVAGLKGYLGKEYENLYVVDIICHGVPSVKFFQAYIDQLMKKFKGNILDFKFRDKTNGWGESAKIIYKDKSEKIKSKLIPSGASSYFDMFLKTEILRENCYSCPYATMERVGDITVGDYWGIQREHPELMLDAGGPYSDTQGISCILVNNEKGQQLIEKLSNKVSMNLSTVKKVANQNGQLKHPSNCPETRKEILQLYSQKGYIAVEEYFRKRNGVRTQYCYLKNMIPHSFKKNLKKLLKNKY